MCTLYKVQFPGTVNSSDNTISVNGLAASNTAWVIDDLVDNNPLFWYEPGMNGVQTLTTVMSVEEGVDLTLGIKRSGNTISIKGIQIKDHPIHRPH